MYKRVIRPLLFRLEPEAAHRIALRWLFLVGGFAPTVRAVTTVHDSRLSTAALGLNFSSPVGLAAGVDKDGRTRRGWEALGVGFAEIGTVTPRPQAGNPRPRVFRLPADKALINRLGFNSEGCVAVAARLARAGKAAVPVGINVGRNRDTPNERAIEDYVEVIKQCVGVADYFVVNVSSPNTQGLRELHAPLAAAAVMHAAVTAAVRKDSDGSLEPIPVLIKLAPDFDEHLLLETTDAALEAGAAGIVITNTTTGRDGITLSVDEVGGLSGVPLRARANSLCQALYGHVGARVPIIGVGGIFSASDAYERLRSGASLVQVCTGLFYEGPWLFRRINQGLLRFMDRDHVSDIAQVIGRACHTET